MAIERDSASIRMKAPAVNYQDRYRWQSMLKAILPVLVIMLCYMVWSEYHV